MNRSVSYFLLAALSAGVFAVAVPSGASESSGGAGARARVAKTITLRSITKSEVQLGKYSFAGTDLLKIDGKKAGFDVYRGTFDPKSETLDAEFTIALKNGTIRGTFQPGDEGLTGKVTGGTGAYDRARGSLSGRDIRNGVGDLTIELR